MALEHVAQGQTRFFTPGVAPDPRGILLGRSCLMTFATLEGAVSWFRLYSSEAALDELLSNLAITKCRTALGSRREMRWIGIPAEDALDAGASRGEPDGRADQARADNGERANRSHGR